ncbi:MAG TPA: glycosyltransferase [Bryobacteraceae bacterium]|nr:glycosyltransferase [Bryobacteraceae bacterium]
MVKAVTLLWMGVAAIPFIYYLLALFSSWRYFRQPFTSPDASFTPPVSILKPFRGLDPDAYDNLVSFCRQDYPVYELIFCVDPDDESVRPVVEKLQRDFPAHEIRILFGSGRAAANDKVAKLARMASEARNEVVVISDSDVRVQPDYLRSMVAPLSDPKVGAVTCFYVHTDLKTFADRLQTVGMMSDFYAGILVAWQLDGIKFALGPSIATTRARLAGFGGYAAIENSPGDDLLVGRLIAEQGYEVRLLRYTVSTVSDYRSVRDLLHKRMRWIVVMRHMRPWGHFGLAFTQGLPWSLLAVAIHPTLAVAAGYLGAYLAIRMAMTWVIGVYGLKQEGLWSQMLLIPIWDAVAFGIWLGSFLRTSIRWRGADYYIREGQLVPVAKE